MPLPPLLVAPFALSAPSLPSLRLMLRLTSWGIDWVQGGSMRRCVDGSLHRCIATVHHCITALLHYCIAASPLLHRCIDACPDGSGWRGERSEQGRRRRATCEALFFLCRVVQVVQVGGLCRCAGCAGCALCRACRVRYAGRARSRCHSKERRPCRESGVGRRASGVMARLALVVALAATKRGGWVR